MIKIIDILLKYLLATLLIGEKMNILNKYSNEIIFKYTIFSWGVIASLFHIWISIISFYDTFVVVPVHVFLIGGLGFIF